MSNEFLENLCKEQESPGGEPPLVSRTQNIALKSGSVPASLVKYKNTSPA